MKKILSFILVICLLLSFAVFALGSGSDETKDQGTGSIETKNNEETKGQSAETKPKEDPTVLGNYRVEIKSCRLAQDYSGKDVVIVLYSFTNVKNDEPASFSFAIKDSVYQDGVGLNGAYVLSESANYSADNQTKEIKKGASIDVEVAYELNDSSTDIEVEVEELFGFSNKTLKKVFTLK
jgi:hypothetical protein